MCANCSRAFIRTSQVQFIRGGGGPVRRGGGAGERWGGAGPAWGAWRLVERDRSSYIYILSIYSISHISLFAKYLTS